MMLQKLFSPLFTSRVAAGFPSPAADHIEERLNLQSKFVPRPLSTFFMRAENDAMRESGVDTGDLLVVDKSLQAANGCLAVCIVEGEFILRRLRIKNGLVTLQSDSPEYADVTIAPEADFSVWGIVTSVVHEV